MTTTRTPQPTSSGFWRGLAAALVAVLALGLAATVVSAQTGGDDEADGADDPPAVDEEAFEAYKACLEENGAMLPEDGERPDRDEITDEQREAFREAREACTDLHPFAEEIAAARECLEENGVELPEEGERPARDELTDEQREALQEAREACDDVLPGGGPRGFGHHRVPGGPGGDTEEQPAGFGVPGGPGGLPAQDLTTA